MKSLAAMLDFCNSVQCRHRAIVEYFGQVLSGDSCGACDVCLGQLDLVDEPLAAAQKILSCVLRLKERFGGDYTAKVLHGCEEQRIVHQGHDQLSTWGLLSHETLRTSRDWIEQLVSQGFLVKEGEYNLLRVTPAGHRLLSGQVVPRLLRPAKSAVTAKARAARDVDAWEGVDRGLFEELRRLRHEQAAAQDVPAYIIFSDASLRELARRRPSTLNAFRQVPGVGDKKLADYGQAFVGRISDYCRAQQLAMDVLLPETVAATSCLPAADITPSMSAISAFPLFRQGLSVQQVAQRMGRASSTVHRYLVDYLRNERICDPTLWVDATIAQRVTSAAEQTGMERLKPIYELLGGQVDYDQIRIVVVCRQNAVTQHGD